MIELKSVGHSIDIVQASLAALLDSNRLLSLATLDSRALPYSNTAYFAATDQLTMIIFSEPEKHHSINLESRARFSAVIFDSHQTGSPLQGLQLSGVGRRLSGADAERAHSTYGERYPDIMKTAPSYKDVEANFHSRYYELSIEHLRVYDETRFSPEEIVDVTIQRG